MSHPPVLMLTNKISPDGLGGHERYVRELAAHLVARGHSVTVFARAMVPGTPAPEVADDGVIVHRYAVPPKSNKLFALQRGLGPIRHALREALARPRPVSHAHFVVPALPLAVLGLPYIYTFHSPLHREILDEHQGTYTLPRGVRGLMILGMRRAEAFVLWRAKQVVVLSDYSRNEVRELSARAARRTVLVPGGIDVTRFRPGAPRPHTLTAGASGPVLFAARRLTPRTGVQQLIEAMPAVRKRFPSAQLYVAGTGEQSSTIQRVIQHLNLDDAVHLLGWLDDARLREWYCAADLVVMPTQQLEGFGLTTAEALACGTPVVGTPSGATPEILAPVDPRLIASGVTPPEIADCVVGYLSDASLQHRCRVRARGRAEGLSWEAVTRAHEALYGGA